MTDGTAAPAAEARTVPAWYWIVAVGALLFELFGCFFFANSFTIDPEALPLDQRAFFDATPQWMNMAWGVAVITGLAGAIGLLLRRRFAEPLLLISMVAVIIQFSGLVLVGPLRQLMSEEHLMFPIVVLILVYAFWQTSKLAKKRGWLR